MSGTYLAFDLGATSWRAFLGQEKDEGFDIEEIYREQNTPVKKTGGLFWNIRKIFHGMKSVLKGVSERGIQPAAIGIDSWSVDYGLIDKNGCLLEQPRCYRDPRNQGIKEKLTRYIEPRELFLRTGLLFEEITTLCQLLAARESTPGILDKAYHLLFIPDLLRYWLCNEIATDFTLATTSQVYNISEKYWDPKLISLLQLPEHIFPHIVYGSSVLSTLSVKIQKETGLGPLHVTTGASHDTAAAFSTVKGDKTNAILSSGTWSMLGVHMDNPVFFDSIKHERFGYEGNPDGTVRLLCNIPGMWLLEKCRSEWKMQGLSCPYDLLLRDAQESTHFNSIIDPYNPSFSFPEKMTEAIKIYCRETGQIEPGTMAEFTRAIIMGLVDTYASAIQEIEDITKIKIKKLHIIGGGSQNFVLNQLIAERAGIKVVNGWVEATTIGNLLNQKRAVHSR